MPTRQRKIEMKKELLMDYKLSITNSREHYNKILQIRKELDDDNFEKIKMSCLLAKTNLKIKIYLYNFDVENVKKQLIKLKEYQNIILDDIMFGTNKSTVKIIDEENQFKLTYEGDKQSENARQTGNLFLHTQQEYEKDLYIISQLQNI